MGRPKGSGKKDPFEFLKTNFKEWVDKIATASETEIRAEVTTAALNEVLNRQNEKADEDLQAKKVLVKEAAAQYKDATKANTQKVAFARQVLGDRGLKL